MPKRVSVPVIGNFTVAKWQALQIVGTDTFSPFHLFVPDDQQSLYYDLDGNLTFDGVWS
jgi:hypothetical protein